MKKLILIDGNNLMFRSYYATIYNGQMMKNSQGFPTNALFGFVAMLNKIINEETPSYMVVAFDIGKNFRKEQYDFYKEGRISTPEELKMQMPIAREILDCYGIKHLELAPYEADDIIGTITKITENDPNFKSVIISSDKDLLQLISQETEIKLLKQTSYIRYDYDTFVKDYGILPEKVVDLKALMGDSSDNIPGVKGIGEKTALKLLQEYDSLENLYANISNLKPSLQEKLLKDKDNAFMSKSLAQIYRDVPLKTTLEDLKFTKQITSQLINKFQELEFFSILKSLVPLTTSNEITYKEIKNLAELEIADNIGLYLELDNENYHLANVLGMGLSDKNHNYFIPANMVKEVLNKIKDKNIFTYDAKKTICQTKVFFNCVFDLELASYLLNYNIKDDLSYLANQFDNNIIFYDQLKKDKFPHEIVKSEVIKKSRFIFEKAAFFKEELIKNEVSNLYQNIESPLINVLAAMEIAGIKVDEEILKEMASDIQVKIELLTTDIYNQAGVKFNISSPKQLGEVLFETLGLKGGKKNKTGYKTDVKVLEKLLGKHPIIAKVLEYRNLTKLKSTYLEGLTNYILEDGKIHTIYKQTLTRTGRLSSTEPNLQNIPIREELGRKVRKAFVPINDYILSADYSQIELRVLAHMANAKGLKNAFLEDKDIHTSVASKIYGLDESLITKKMRRTAKAVVFGMIYGISGFGLGENLNISRHEGDLFIEKFYKLYPEVKTFMDSLIKNAHENGYVKTLFNRKRIITEINNPNHLIRNMGERMAMNTPIQGTSADIMKLAMIKVFNKFKENNLKSQILLQVHDEIIVDVKKSELEQVKKIVKEEMENVVKLEVPLKVAIEIGSNWYEA